MEERLFIKTLLGARNWSKYLQISFHLALKQTQKAGALMIPVSRKKKLRARENLKRVGITWLPKSRTGVDCSLSFPKGPFITIYTLPLHRI